MNRNILFLFVLITLFSVGGCTSVSIIYDQSKVSKLHPKPDYQDYAEYYFWGFKNNETFRMGQICMDESAVMAKRKMTFEDSIFAVLSLGIYIPHTVQVWCASDES